MDLQEMINFQLKMLNEHTIKIIFEKLGNDYKPFDKNMIEHEFSPTIVHQIRIEILSKKLSGKNS